MLQPGTRKAVIGAIAVLFGLSMWMGHKLSIKHQEYEQTPDSKTPFQALAPALLGFRQVAASLLWVKTDDYFHEGQYEPILRMVRLITTIDPHQIDVYTTGAWHMAYNFMDKRLIRTGLEFLEGGVKNNPTIYDLYFESGYTNMDKTRDFPKAIYWYTEASTKGTTDGKTMPPMFTWFQLAHAYEASGDIALRNAGLASPPSPPPGRPAPERRPGLQGHPARSAQAPDRGQHQRPGPVPGEHRLPGQELAAAGRALPGRSDPADRSRPGSRPGAGLR